MFRLLFWYPGSFGFKNRKEAKKFKKGEVFIDIAPYFYFPKALRFTYAFTLTLSLFAKLFSIRRFKPDFLLLSWAYPDAVGCSILAKLLKIPYFVKVHGSDINMHASNYLRAKQIAWALNDAEAVISVSQALAVKMSNIGIQQSKVKVIYNGINHKVFRLGSRCDARKSLGLKSDRSILLYIGNLKATKGCMDLLEAFNQISRQHKDVDLYFIGDGPVRKSIIAKSNEYGLNGRVFILGIRPHQELVSWIQSCDAVVLPSHNEGVPNVLLESMACGVPVVATAVGGIPEVVDEKVGILVELGNAKELQDALVTVISRDWDPSLIECSVADFTWERNIKQMEEVFQKNLINSH